MTGRLGVTHLARVPVEAERLHTVRVDVTLPAVGAQTSPVAAAGRLVAHETCPALTAVV